MAFLELVTLLPPGAPSQTRLARHGTRLVVLRELKEGTACFYPEPSPGLVTLEEVGELQGKRHALFPYLPGVTLRDVVHAFQGVGKAVPLGLVGAVVLAAARALAAHQPPKPHGGLNDAALQVAFTGETFVLDFGAPRITRFKALGRESLSADVFALGGVLHTALTGYQGAYVNPPSALVPPSSVHPEATPALDDVVLRALSPQVPARQRDVGALADELEVVLGPLYATDDLAALVRSLFQDRIRLLQSLSGLTEALPMPGLGDEPEESKTASHPVHQPGPFKGIPMGTEPGSLGDGTNPGARLPWLVDDAEPAAEVSDEGDGGTQPRIEAPAPREEVTNPGAPAPSERPARRPEPLPSGEGTRTTGDRLSPVATRPPAAPPRVTSDETDAGHLRAPRPSAANLRALPEAPAVRPSAANLRAMPDDVARGPRPQASAPRPSGVRQSLPAPSLADAEVEGTSPGSRPPVGVEDTAPRAKAPAFELAGPRNTTTHERLRAAGQERVATPPAGSPAVGLGDEIEAMPTALRPRLVVPDDDVVHAETMQKLPAVPAPKRGGRGLIALLLLVVAGLAAAWAMKQGHLPAPGPLAELLDLRADAGAEPEAADAGEATEEGPPDAGERVDAGDEQPGDGGAEALVVGAADAGVATDGGATDAGAADGGSLDGGGVTDAGAAADAGLDGGTLDAGVDAGVPDDKSKPPPKKKKRRR